MQHANELDRLEKLLNSLIGKFPSLSDLISSQPGDQKQQGKEVPKNEVLASKISSFLQRYSSLNSNIEEDLAIMESLFSLCSFDRYKNKNPQLISHLSQKLEKMPFISLLIFVIEWSLKLIDSLFNPQPIPVNMDSDVEPDSEDTKFMKGLYKEVKKHVPDYFSLCPYIYDIFNEPNLALLQIDLFSYANEEIRKKLQADYSQFMKAISEKFKVSIAEIKLIQFGQFPEFYAKFRRFYFAIYTYKDEEKVGGDYLYRENLKQLYIKEQIEEQKEMPKSIEETNQIAEQHDREMAQNKQLTKASSKNKKRNKRRGNTKNKQSDNRQSNKGNLSGNDDTNSDSKSKEDINSNKQESQLLVKSLPQQQQQPQPHQQPEPQPQPEQLIHQQPELHQLQISEQRFAALEGKYNKLTEEFKQSKQSFEMSLLSLNLRCNEYDKAFYRFENLFRLLQCRKFAKTFITALRNYYGLPKNQKHRESIQNILKAHNSSENPLDVSTNHLIKMSKLFLELIKSGNLLAHLDKDKTNELNSIIQDKPVIANDIDLFMTQVVTMKSEICCSKRFSKRIVSLFKQVCSEKDRTLSGFFNEYQLKQQPEAIK